MLRTDWWGEARENSTPTRQLNVLISFCRGHHSPQSTTHSWEVLRCAKDYSKTRGGMGKALILLCYCMRKLLAKAKEWALLLIQVIPWGISSCKVWSSDKVLEWRDRSSHLLHQARHVHSTFLSTTYNSLILLAAVTRTRSVPLVYKMPFQIKLLFSLIKLHIWAKTATLIQLNYLCLQLLFGAEHTEIS